MQRPCPVQSTVTGWHNKSVSRASTFPSLKPRFNPLNHARAAGGGRLSYRKHLSHAQVYCSQSRQEYVDKLRLCWNTLPCDRTLQIRWRLHKELPAFSVDFLFLYLSRFGKVEAICQQALNSCLVLFDHHRTAWKVANDHTLGLPYGRLYAKLWSPQHQERDPLKVMSHLEKAAHTRCRFQSLLDADDRNCLVNFLRAGARAVADGNRSGGPTLQSYLCEGVKKLAPVRPVKPPKPPRQQEVRPEGKVIHTENEDEFHQLIQETGQLVVVDFFASWCGPCKIIAPVIDQWAKEMPEVKFVKVDIDELPDVSDEFQISAMPTFLLFRHGEVVDAVIGAAQDKLKEAILCCM